MFVSSNEIVQIVTTVARVEDAKRLASIAIAQRLAACVQIDGPIESLYRWKGEIACDQEWRLVVKTTRVAGARLIAILRSEHPYEEPELLVIPFIHVSQGYLSWVLTEVICPRLEFLLYGSAAGPFESNFESMLARIELLPRMFIEMDGSFVWRPEGDRNWQIDGMVYDANQHVQYIDLKGEAPTAMWESLFEKIAGDDSLVNWQVVLNSTTNEPGTRGKLNYPLFAHEHLLSSE